MSRMRFHVKVGVAATLSAVSLLMASCASDIPPPKQADAAPAAPAAHRERTGFNDTPENIRLRSAPGDAIAGREKSVLCQGCHGEKGMSAETMIPNLAGQYGKYIAKNLRNFQSGARTHQIMSAMAKTISDDDLADIAAYFASQPKMQGGGPVPDSDIGKNLFLYGDMNRLIVSCINCHGVNGKGKAPDNSIFPVIGGQQAGYLRGQLLNWRAGERVNSPGGIMNIIAKKLSDEEIESLANYISGL
jgi:cytochrome c553